MVRKVLKVRKQACTGQNVRHVGQNVRQRAEQARFCNGGPMWDMWDVIGAVLGALMLVGALALAALKIAALIKFINLS